MIPCSRLVSALLLSLATFAAPASAGLDPGRTIMPAAGFDLAARGFEPNAGQASAEVRFLARTPGLTIAIHSDGFVLQPPTGGAVRVSVLGGDPEAAAEGTGPLSGRVSYFRGTDPSDWQKGLPTYREVMVRRVLPGVDLRYHAAGSRLELDLVLAPGAETASLRLSVAGATSVAVGHSGRLLLGHPAGRLELLAPVVYQEGPAGKHEVPARYVLVGPAEVAFDIGLHDAGLPLVIDPVVAFATYLGGGTGSGPGSAGTDAGWSAALAADGSVVVVGLTGTPLFPQVDPLFPFAGTDDLFVSRFSPDGSTLLFSTLIGGSGNDGPRAVVLDEDGSVVVAGSTNSPDFPTTSGALQPAFAGGAHDGYLLRLAPDGSDLVFSTFVGGSLDERLEDVDLATGGEAVVIGSTGSPDIPTTPSSFQPALAGLTDAYLARISADGSDLVFGTYLGGSSVTRPDVGRAVRVGPNGSIYATGYADSSDFPVTADAFQTAHSPDKRDAWVSRLSADGTVLEASTFLGGLGSDRGQGIALQSDGTVVATGQTGSPDFPVTADAFQPTLGGISDGYLVRLSDELAELRYSSYIGGSDADGAVAGLAVDERGGIHLAGWTESSDFPLMDPVQPAFGGVLDAFLAELTPDGRELVHSTFVGGSGNDGVDLTTVGRHALDVRNGRACLTGRTESPDFPVVAPLQGALAGPVDAFVACYGLFLQVEIDIKPGNPINSLNAENRGTFPVAVLGAADLDASTVDAASLTLAGAPVRLRGDGAPMASLHDFDGDGHLDLLVHIETQGLEIEPGQTTLVLEGETVDGRRIRGSDEARLVPPGS